MRYPGIFKSVEREQMPSPEEMERMGKLMDEMVRQGVLLMTEGCLPSAQGLRLRHRGGEFTVVDGPFLETTEQIGGFALLQVDSREELIEWTKRFAEVAGDGEIELRRLYEAPAYSPADSGESDRVKASETVA